jgi:hypothetical protein
LNVLAGLSVGDEEALASVKEYEVSSESTPHGEKESDLEPDELTEDPVEAPKPSAESSSGSSSSYGPEKDHEDDLLSPLSLETKRQSQFLKEKLEEMDVDLDNVKCDKELQQRLIDRTVEEMEEAEEEEQGQDERTTANNAQQKEELLSPLTIEKKRQSELMQEMLIETDVDPDEMERNRERQQRLTKGQQPKEKQQAKLRSNGEDHDVGPKTTEIRNPIEASIIEPAIIEHKQVTTKPKTELTPSPTSEIETKIVEESSTKVREIQVNTPNNKEEDFKASAVAVPPSDRRPISKAAVRDAKRALILANMHRLDKTMEQARRLIQ